MSLPQNPRSLTLLLLAPLGVMAACSGELSPLNPPNDSASGGNSSGGNDTTASGGDQPGGDGGGKASGGDEGSLGGMGGGDTGTGGDASTGGSSATGGSSGSGGDAATGGGSSCDHASECLTQTQNSAFCSGDVPGICEDTDVDGCLEYYAQTACTTSCNSITGACASGDTCADAIEVQHGDEISGTNFYEDFSDRHNFNGSDCKKPYGNEHSPEAVFAIDLKAGQTLTIREYGTIDAVVGLQRECVDGGACLESWDQYEQEGTPYTALVDERIYAWVTTYYASSTSSTNYSISFYIGQCGDGEVNGLEDCDDQNDVDGDGCSACVRDPLDLGTFNLGDPIPTLVDELPLRNGSTRSYFITFTEPVWLTGLVAAAFGESPRIDIRNREGLYRTSSDDSGLFQAVYLEPGQSELILGSGDEILSEGITLSLNTPTAFNLGEFELGDSKNFAGGPIPSKGSIYYRFTILQEANVTTTASLDAGDPDLWGYDSSGTRVFLKDAVGTTETYGPSSFAAGEYFVRLYNYETEASTHQVTVNVDAP